MKAFVAALVLLAAGPARADDWELRVDESADVEAGTPATVSLTIAGLGVLCLLLGWAQHMRSVPVMGWTWLVLGVVLLFLGGVAVVFPRSRDRRQLRATGGTEFRATEDEGEREQEEQLY